VGWVFNPDLRGKARKIGVENPSHKRSKSLNWRLWGWVTQPLRSVPHVQIIMGFTIIKNY